MRTKPIAIAVAALMLGQVPALAQKAEPKRPAGATKKYLPLDGLTFAPAPVSQFEGMLTIALQAGKAAGGAVDACMGPDPLLNRADRLVGTLEAKGGSLTGSGTSKDAGKPWSIEVRQSGSGDSVRVEGRIGYDGRTYPFTGSDLSLSDAPTLTDDAEGEPDISLAESDPNTLGQVDVDVPPNGLSALVALLSREGGGLHPGAATPGCSDLRAGKRSMKVVVAPDRAEALLAAINATAGLKARMAADYTPGNRVRVGAPEAPKSYGEGGERSLADKVAATAAGILPGLAVVEGPARDPATGRWKVVLERPSGLGDGVPLRERDTLTFLVGRSPATRDRAIVAFESLATRYVTEAGKAGGLVLEGQDGSIDEIASTDLVTSAAIEAVRDAVARRLGGDVMQGDPGKWVPVAPLR